jgi:Tfp pilus assembly protein PilO
MGAQHSNRLWMVAGFAAAVLLGIGTWFLAISPQRTDAAALQVQTHDANAQAEILRTRIGKLKADQAQEEVLKKALIARKAALPEDSGVPAFLRQLQITGTTVGVDISGITVGDPVPVDTVPGVYELPIQLTAEGTEARLGDYLKLLQGADQKRAVLIEVASLSKAEERTSLNLTVKAFVAPPAGAGTPSITTD